MQGWERIGREQVMFSECWSHRARTLSSVGTQQGLESSQIKHLQGDGGDANNWTSNAAKCKIKTVCFTEVKRALLSLETRGSSLCSFHFLTVNRDLVVRKFQCKRNQQSRHGFHAKVSGVTEIVSAKESMPVWSRPAIDPSICHHRPSEHSKV